MLKKILNKLPINFMELEAETIREILQDNLQADKILALRALCGSEYPYKDVHVFNTCALAINDIPIQADFFYKAELKHIEYMLRLVSHMCVTNKPFTLSDDVVKYLETLCRDENIHWFPETFKLSILNPNIYHKEATEEAIKAWKDKDSHNIFYVKLKLIDLYCNEKLKEDGVLAFSF